jgi:hypothetical protein
MSGTPQLGAFLGGKCGRVSLGTAVPTRSNNTTRSTTTQPPMALACIGTLAITGLLLQRRIVASHHVHATMSGAAPPTCPSTAAEMAIFKSRWVACSQLVTHDHVAPPRHVCWEVKALPPLVLLDNSRSCVHMHVGEWARQLGRGVPGPRPAALRFLNRRVLGPHPCRPLQRALPTLPHRAPHCRWGIMMW